MVSLLSEKRNLFRSLIDVTVWHISCLLCQLVLMTHGSDHESSHESDIGVIYATFECHLPREATIFRFGTSFWMIPFLQTYLRYRLPVHVFNLYHTKPSNLTSWSRDSVFSINTAYLRESSTSNKLFILQLSMELVRLTFFQPRNNKLFIRGNSWKPCENSWSQSTTFILDKVWNSAWQNFIHLFRAAW